ncbi:hypothetical protein BLNAU_4235 [Blattamonas nauphoetae]|uniref:Uncharacterized protein n=1 Tax=Blattamonas nauphoetae TaxID=2049346 RepID=A0ABQ9YAN4_9EUKA|nr:hypothetical protein BLNAU_4235 [Blattamonas nauphoetae]
MFYAQPIPQEPCPPSRTFQMKGKRTRVYAIVASIIFLVNLILLLFLQTYVFILIILFVLCVVLFVVAIVQCCNASEATITLKPTKGIMKISIRHSCCTCRHGRKVKIPIRELAHIQFANGRQEIVQPSGTFTENGSYSTTSTYMRDDKVPIVIHRVDGRIITLPHTFSAVDIEHLASYIRAYNAPRPVPVQPTFIGVSPQHYQQQVPQIIPQQLPGVTPVYASPGGYSMYPQPVQVSYVPQPTYVTSAYQSPQAVVQAIPAERAVVVVTGESLKA